MLHESQDPAGHEAGGAHGRAASRQLGDLDQSPAGADVDPAAGARGFHLVGAGATPRVDHDLYSITFHTVSNAFVRSRNPGPRRVFDGGSGYGHRAMTVLRTVPGLGVERALWESGAEVVVGVDEVGRGSWAGPISVGAAVLPRDRRLYKVRDSKMLTEAEREHLFPRLAGWCRTWAVGHASQQECDDLGMSAAQKLAARRAIEGLGLGSGPPPILV
jgi:Ribonuclease HII